MDADWLIGLNSLIDWLIDFIDWLTDFLWFDLVHNDWLIDLNVIG